MPEIPKEPIFFDPQRKRWKRISLTSSLIGLLFTLIFGALLGSMFVNPSLPGLSLGPVHFFQPPPHISGPTATGTPAPHATASGRSALSSPTPEIVSTDLGGWIIHTTLFTESPGRKADKKAVKGEPGRRRVQIVTTYATYTPIPAGAPLASNVLTLPNLLTDTPAAATPISATATAEPLQAVTPAAPARGEVIGFYVDWDQNALASLQQNINSLDKLIPEWLHLADASGSLTPDDPDVQQQTLDFIKINRPNLPVMVLVNNFNKDTQTWDQTRLAGLLADPAARARNIQALLDFVNTNHLQGVSVDFEDVPTASKNALTVYMRELYGRFHPLGLEVSESVPVDDQAFDYPALAKYNDYLILMAYDEHWSSSPPGPVASQQMYANALNLRLSEVEPSKYALGIGAYGYDWMEGASEAQDVSYEDAIRTAQNYKVSVRMDPSSLNPTFDYTDENGKRHHVWFLDAVTAFNQMAEAHRYAVRGFALWRMGSEDPAIWRVFDQRASLDATSANALAVVHFSDHLYYQGSGEILKIASTPRDGQRTLNYDTRLGLITNENYTVLPSSYTIDRWGAADKKLALTFDDGPDAKWTPQILDILQQKNAQATFFVIGSNGDANPDILRSIVAQGSEVGNHSYTHPDVSAISQAQFQIELNATERLFESVLGRRSVLFRPPYSEDVEPDTADQVKPLLFTSQLGYYTIGMKIDPSDYLLPGVDVIVQRVVDRVTSGAGNIILMHDSGGDRSQTVAALPLIIDQLRQRGYQFVLVSDLMGLTRDQVMPGLSAQTSVISTINDIGFQTTNTANQVISYLFMTGIVLGILRFLVIAVLAFLQHRVTRDKAYPPDFKPSLSIIVPAYNEAKVIDKTIDTLLASTYTTADIIVVDDGSSDNTYARLLELYGHNPRVRVFTKENAGKAVALNYGIEQSRSEIIMAMDADTIILPEAVEKLARHFADPRVAAVAGNAKVGNRINLLTNWQALEYITGQNLDRRAFALLNCITVVPGAIGAWRRELVLAMGGFTSQTLAEDADLTLTLLRNGYKIDYEEAAIALTEAPDSVQGFLKQRFRWNFGTLQAAWKHLGVLMNPKYGTLGLIAIPNILIFQIFFPLISPLMDLAALAAAGQIIWERYQHPLHPAPDELTHLIVFYLLFLAFDFLTALSAFLLERKEDWRLINWLFPQRFYYRQLMYYIAIKSFLTAIRGHMVGWGKLERKATVHTGR